MLPKSVRMHTLYSCFWNSSLLGVISRTSTKILIFQGNTIKASSDPLQIHRGPITRARAKKMQAALNGLIKKIWIENAIQNARHHELGLKRRQGIIGIIQAIGQPNKQFGFNVETENSE